jgi:hypothetical protein
MSRVALIFASALTFASETCIPTGTLDPKGDSGDSSLTETGDSQGMGPCESGFCDLTVTEAVVECAEGITGEPSVIEATAGVGTITVWHQRVSQGCCPQLSVTAMQDLRHDTIEVEYDLYDDMCDCICELDIRYTLSDVYSGSFELSAAGSSTTVKVE